MGTKLTGVIADHIRPSTTSTPTRSSRPADDAYVNDNRREMQHRCHSRWIETKCVVTSDPRCARSSRSLRRHHRASAYEGEYDKSKLPPAS